jgi:hypothetical protein
MRVAFLVASVLALLASATAVGQEAGWVADGSSDCKLWIDVPHAGATVNWSGACVGGLAEGPGIVTTSTGNRYEGGFRAGRREGHGVLTYLNGNRFEGEWHANKPNGPGSYNQAGHVFSGLWADGCFDHDGSRAVVGSTAHDCGFE